MECLALPILSTLSIRGASRENLQYMDTRRICKLQKGIIYRAVIIIHHCNMLNLCRFKTLTFKLEQWKHFESDLLQNDQLSCSSTASLIWWHMWVKMCITTTHQLDVSVSNNGAELTQIPHHPIENLSDAFPLVAAHFLDTGQLHLQSHEVCLCAESIREEKGGEKWSKREKRQVDMMQQRA